MEPKVQKRGPRKISVLYPLPNISQGEAGENEKPKQRVAAYVQATFWELRLDQVVTVRHFKGRLK